MGQFGSGQHINKDQSMLDRSIEQMQHERPVMIDGEGKNTFEKDGRFYLLDREVSEQEYNQGLDRYQTLLDGEIQRKRDQLN